MTFATQKRGLRSLGDKLYHTGFHGYVSRSTLADADDAHDWLIYAHFAQVLRHFPGKSAIWRLGTENGATGMWPRSSPPWVDRGWITHHPEVGQLHVFDP